jgi:hypothetical protein
MVKWRFPLDSARQIGLETALIDFLIANWRGTTKERSGVGGILKIGKLGAFLLVPLEPRVAESNGERS